MAEVINSFEKGIYRDTDPINQPPNTTRFVQNLRLISDGDNTYSYESTKGTVVSFSLPQGLKPIGYARWNKKIVLISTKTTREGEIGIVDIDEDGVGAYFTYYKNPNMGLSDEHPILDEAIVVPETDKFAHLRWTDNNNPPRSINLIDSNPLTIPIQTLDFQPLTQLKTMGYVEKTEGSLLCGSYAYVYRYKSKRFRIKSTWSQPTNTVPVVRKISDTIVYGSHQGGASDRNSDTGNILSIPLDFVGIYDTLEIAYFFSTGFNVFEPGNVFESLDISTLGGEIHVKHIRNDSLEIVQPTDVSIPDRIILRAASMAIIKNNLYLTDIDENNETEIKNIPFTSISPFTYKLPSDTVGYNIDQLKPPLSGHLLQKIFSTSPATIIPEGKYKVNSGIWNYKNQIYNPGDIITGDIADVPEDPEAKSFAYSSSQSPVLVPILRIQKYIKDPQKNITVNKDIPVINDFFDYKGVATCNNLRSYWRGETYRFGVLCYKNARPLFVRWLKDVDMPEQYDSFPKFTLTSDFYSIKALGIEISGLDMTEFINAGIDGFSIVRAPSKHKIVAQGIIYPMVEKNLPTASPVTFSEQHPFNHIIPNNEAGEITLGQAVVNDLIGGVRRNKNVYVIYSPDILLEHKDSVIGSGNKAKLIGYLADGYYWGTDGFTARLPNTDLSMHKQEANKGSRFGKFFDELILNDYLDSYENIGGVAYQKMYKYVIDSVLKTLDITAKSFGEKRNILRSYNVDVNEVITIDTGGVEGYNYNIRFYNLSEFYWLKANDYLGPNGGHIIRGFFSVGGKCSIIVVDGEEKRELNPNRPKRVNTVWWEDGFGFWDRTSLVKPVVNITRADSNLYSSPSSDLFIHTGHYQEITETVKNDVFRNGKYIFDGVQVFGGDCFVSLFSVARLLKNQSLFINDGKLNIDFGIARAPASHNIWFPVESYVNPNFREGRTLDKNGAYAPISNFPISGIAYDPTAPENFIYNPAYSSDDAGIKFAPLPDSFSPQKRFPNRVLFSETKTMGEQIDSYRVFKQGNFIDTDSVNGDNKAIREHTNRLFYFQDRAVGYIPVKERVSLPIDLGLPMQIGISDKIDRFDEQTKWYGLQHKWSLLKTPWGFSWFDYRNRAVMKMVIGGGIQNLSVVRGLHSFFYNHDLNALSDSDNPLKRKGIISWYDPRFKEVVMFFNQGNEKNLTIAFNELMDRFGSTYKFYPDMAFYHEKFIFCGNGNEKISVFNKGLPSVFFGGEPQDEIIEFVINQNHTVFKVFDNIQLKGNEQGFNEILYQTDEQNIPESLVSFSNTLINSNFEYRNRYWVGSVPLINGERIRGNYLIIRLKRTPNNGKLIKINHSKTMFRQSL